MRSLQRAKRLVHATSMSHLWPRVENHPCALLSAHSRESNAKENNRRSMDLLAYLQKGGRVEVDWRRYGLDESSGSEIESRVRINDRRFLVEATQGPSGLASAYAHRAIAMDVAKELDEMFGEGHGGSRFRS